MAATIMGLVGAAAPAMIAAGWITERKNGRFTRPEGLPIEAGFGAEILIAFKLAHGHYRQNGKKHHAGQR